MHEQVTVRYVAPKTQNHQLLSGFGQTVARRFCDQAPLTRDARSIDSQSETLTIWEMFGGKTE